ncbi:ABC transporter permease [Loktanella sp. SALINAS62]|uniref:ABC transporter permease n=1 Tax=Loktanella sp. SALINAS62 TaxID=2706124 RepID=UPI001B8BF9F1|nr:ABC transporter permease [Loktanella sp. SALINAS62]MBS1301745.1 ABC transporter permease [Loktanella sp. SALINAS62]
MTETSLPEPKLKPPRFQAIRAIVALILREMSSTYGASPGGYIWAVLQPVGMLALLSLAFSLIVRAPSLGTSFVLFYATGFLPFTLYSEIEGKTSGAILYSKALLAYPRMTWIDTIIARLILNTLTQAAVFCIVIAGIIVIFELRLTITVGPILIGLAMAILLGLGVGLMNAVLFGLFPVWKTIWRIITRPLFLASGIFFILEDMPPFVQEILWWNPLMHVSGLVRVGFYSVYHPNYISLTYGFGLALVLILLGLIFLRANYTKVLEAR